MNVILRHVGLLNNSDSQFYIASMILILQYLHERDIIYRDLKPENIMVDNQGFIKLVDFGTAKIIQGRTYTLVGSPHYIAPEVIVGKGYGKMADLWSLGICLYEFLCGRVPFGEEEEDPYRIYEEILEKPLEFPDDIDPIGEVAPIFIRQLLSKFAESRCNGPLEKLKKHDWFAGFDWEQLSCQKITPPYKPDIGEIGEDCQDDLDEPQSPWDMQLNQDSEDTSDSLPEICDTEIEEYKKTIPFNWDQQFL
ncbi:hypothetical protein SteCoe_5550 [Stentor coeruleus]|uniref:non-specific serine/threonine protein kinase n=1 Tax=Stentor coeruleus TaxID=5963 RepID=A0A1R2CSB7_9CILI|nr:hypothetical protein SteCoe_5550 [Stentor coeruleus]